MDGDEKVLSVRPSARRAFWLDGDNRVLAGMNVNIWDVLDDIKSLIRARTPIDPDRLADPDTSLSKLLS